MTLSQNQLSIISLHLESILIKILRFEYEKSSRNINGTAAINKSIREIREKIQDSPELLKQYEKIYNECYRKSYELAFKEKIDVPTSLPFRPFKKFINTVLFNSN